MDRGIEGIMLKHNLTLKEYAQMSDEVRDAKFSDVLRYWHDEPKYDIALYLIAGCQ